MWTFIVPTKDDRYIENSCVFRWSFTFSNNSKLCPHCFWEECRLHFIVRIISVIKTGLYCWIFYYININISFRISIISGGKSSLINILVLYWERMWAQVSYLVESWSQVSYQYRIRQNNKTKLLSVLYRPVKNLVTHIPASADVKSRSDLSTALKSKEWYNHNYFASQKPFFAWTI